MCPADPAHLAVRTCDVLYSGTQALQQRYSQELLTKLKAQCAAALDDILTVFPGQDLCCPGAAEPTE